MTGKRRAQEHREQETLRERETVQGAGLSRELGRDTDGSTPDPHVAPKARPKYTRLRGDGKDVSTVMVYLCGSDLETNRGMATADLNEMLRAAPGESLNLIVETGGARKWNNTVVSARENQRWQVRSDGLVLLADGLGRRDMTDPETLSDFIRNARESFPADRYILILWDHGGGSVSGYGYDQLFGKGSMTLEKLQEALEKGGCRFEFIGFDACLMATLETAMALEPYADYLIASEENEPAPGWDYSGWLSALSRDPSMSALELGRRILDDYAEACRWEAPGEPATLSLVDLAEFGAVIPPVLSAFSASAQALIDTGGYRTLSEARAGSREFAPASRLDQVDLVDLADRLGTPEARILAEAVRGCVKYNRSNLTDAYGLSVYFPYRDLSKMKSMAATYDGIGMDRDYAGCIRSFAGLAAGGRILSGGGTPAPSFSELVPQRGRPGGPLTPGMVESQLGAYLEGDASGELKTLLGEPSGWLSSQGLGACSGYLAKHRVDPAGLTLSRKGEGWVLSLPQEQWELIQTVALGVFVDDGAGYLHLGLDNALSFDGDGDLRVDWDGFWLTLDGHVVFYELLTSERTGDRYRRRGRIPALLNGQPVDLLVTFDNAHPWGRLDGARLCCQELTETQPKGLLAFKPGDTLDLLCGYYTYDGRSQDDWFLGEQITAAGPPTLGTVPISRARCRVACRLTDLYHNVFWTPAVAL